MNFRNMYVCVREIETISSLRAHVKSRAERNSCKLRSSDPLQMQKRFNQ